MPASRGFYRTMIARISPDDVVLYANKAMAHYLGVSKRTLIGSPLETLAARVSGEISECFQRPTGGKTGNRLVTDSAGRVFELKTYSEGGVLDLILDEVTTSESVNCDLLHVSGTSVDELNEDELRTARQPERRVMTVSHSRLAGITHLAERLPPMETRLMINSFVEEAADAILETGCTIDHSSGESVVGIYGAPRYFAEHALRAVRAACDQLSKSAELRAGFFRQGKEMPPMSCGIWTGETFVGTLGSSTNLRYTAIGEPADMAAALCRFARPGEVLVSEFTIQSIVQNPPEGWEAVRAENENEPDLSDFQWGGDDICPLDAELIKGVWLLGPGVAEDTSRMEYYFEYLWSLKVPGHDKPVPVLRVVRPALIGDSVELKSDNVVAAQYVQTLGRYKLLDIIGTGGMGKVWKAQDRYGNIVAVKVLHSSEAASESQLKRFKREAEIMARLPHRNICRVFEMNEFEGIQFIVMEYVDGLTLSDLLYERPQPAGAAPVAADIRSLIQSIRSGRSLEAPTSPDEAAQPASARPKTSRILPVEQTLSMFLKVCEAVQFAHEHGVLHRDLKPGNILLREDGEPLVADFGLAKLDRDGSTQSLSVTGNVVGTLENMAPEQAESSKGVDERADVYSLGTILYLMLTGHRHFDATGNIVADAQALQNYEPPRPRTYNPKLDSDLEIILMKALRNAPDERYRTVAALSADIERYRRGEVITARPVSAIELFRKLILRNRAVSAVAVAALLVIIVGSVAAFWKISERAEAAEHARREAEDALIQAQEQRKLAMSSQKLAEERQTEAERQGKEAERQRAEAVNALAKMKIAQEAEARARDVAAGARRETEEERVAREKAEHARAEAEKQLARMNEAQAKEQEQTRERQQLHAQEAQAQARQSEAAQQAYFAAMQTLHTQLNPMELTRLERNPEEVVRRVDSLIEDASRSITTDPMFTPAWILAGRAHLAAGEVDKAKSLFLTAGTVSKLRDQFGLPPLLGPDDPDAMSALCTKILNSSMDRYARAAAAVRDNARPDDDLIAGILSYFAAKPAVVKTTIGGNPLGRKVSDSEVVVEMYINSGATGHIAVSGNDVTISDIADLSDLSPLKAMSHLSTLHISDATRLDWASLGTLPIYQLDITGCRVDAIPPTLRGLSKLRSLTVQQTGISDIAFARWLPQIESLDISDTNVSDLAPLASCRRLRALDAGGLNLTNLRPLLALPLERLTLNPAKIADTTGLNQLKGHGTLKYLRSPDDPDSQTAAEFWRKFEAGAYRTAEKAPAGN